ncbi:MAG: hypothetical protein ACPGUU_01535 [Flavobacteriaceae bacterium]
MKKLFKIIGAILFLLIAAATIYYFTNSESLPEGKQGKEADALANKVLTAINYNSYKNAEVLEWSFRNKNHYKWFKKSGIVEVTLGNEKVTLNLNDSSKSVPYSPELIEKALNNFNNDSFWLVAPFKIFDEGTERRIVKHNGKDALLITYKSGGSTPGDSYLWILNENGFPTSYKMWTSIIPIGGVSATWSDWKTTKAGIQLPTKHKLSLFGLELDMGNVKASNPKADNLAIKILKAIKHDAYKNTRYLEWSFAGRRTFKWDKKQHVVDVSWDSIRVNLHPEKKNLSTVFFNEKKQENSDAKIIKKAWDIFNNDSFWLVAPHKLFDDGTIRSTEIINGKEALRVTYTKGGTTPGDAYVWEVDENYIPVNYKMYLANKRMNGTPATWENWITTESGTLLPTNHTFGKGRSLSMGTVKGYN